LAAAGRLCSPLRFPIWVSGLWAWPHLKRLGITATIDDQLDLRLPVGEEILSRIDRYGVDLLVAGAFGRFA
jgi:hypothetical protein